MIVKEPVSTLEGACVFWPGCCPPTDTSISPGRISHLVVYSCICSPVIVNESYGVCVCGWVGGVGGGVCVCGGGGGGGGEGGGGGGVGVV